jgi:hypothetical protein
MRIEKVLQIYSKFKKSKFIILCLIAYALLWFGYIKFIVPIFGYSGFKWMPNNLKVVEAILAIVFFTILLPSKIQKPSDFFVHVHFLLPIVPMLVVYSAADFPREHLYYTLSSFTLICLIRKIKMPKIKGTFISMHLMMWGLLIITTILIGGILLHGGLQYINFNPLNVYEYRSLAAHNLPSIYGYLSPMVSKVLLPFILILAVYQRKLFVVCMALTGSVMMFALTNHKGSLIYPILALGIYFVLNFKRHLIQLLILGYTFGILVSLAGFFIDGFGFLLGSLIMRRGFFVPALLNFYYYDFFSEHPHTMFAQSRLTFGFVEYPYDIDASHLIGYHYYNNELTGANTGWLGSAYMHFGFEGMFLYALIIGSMLSMVDSFTKRRDFAISGAVLFAPFLTLFLSSDLPTSMLTHGLIIALFLTWSCQLKGSSRTRRYRTLTSYFKWLGPKNNNFEVIKTESGKK